MMDINPDGDVNEANASESSQHFEEDWDQDGSANNCAECPNDGKFVRCVSKLTNRLKKWWLYHRCGKGSSPKICSES